MAQPIQLIQKTQVWVPAPILGGSTPSLGLHEVPHTYGIHTHEKKNKTRQVKARVIQDLK